MKRNEELCLADSHLGEFFSIGETCREGSARSLSKTTSPYFFSIKAVSVERVTIVLSESCGCGSDFLREMGEWFWVRREGDLRWLRSEPIVSFVPIGTRFYEFIGNEDLVL